MNPQLPTNIHTHELFAFDLDDTLAPSKSAAPQRILEALSKLLRYASVAIISGGNFEQFQQQVLDGLMATCTETELERLHLLPTCGTRYEKRLGGKWHTLYNEKLTKKESEQASTVLREEAKRLGLWEKTTWGEVIEDRGSQVTFSALGQNAPIPAKKAWDPDGSKKNALQTAAQQRLPMLEVRSGGSTSVDVTRRGIDKAYGMRRLAEHANIPLNKILFFGDRLDPQGNDWPVLALGIPAIPVRDWQHTATLLEEINATKT